MHHRHGVVAISLIIAASGLTYGLLAPAHEKGNLPEIGTRHEPVPSITDTAQVARLNTEAPETKKHVITTPDGSDSPAMTAMEAMTAIRRMQDEGNQMARLIVEAGGITEYHRFPSSEVRVAEEFGDIARKAERGDADAAIKAGDIMSRETDPYGMTYKRMLAARQWYRIAANQGRHEGYLGIARTYATEYADPSAPSTTWEDQLARESEQMAHYRIAAQYGSPEAQDIVNRQNAECQEMTSACR